MKRITFLSILAVSGILINLLSGCSKNELLDQQVNDKNGDVGIFKNQVEFCGTPTIANLVDYNEAIYPNYGEYPGTVTVGNDENKLYITYERNNLWTLSDYKLYVGPEGEIPGQYVGGIFQYALNAFPYKIYGNQGTGYEFFIDLNGLDECFAVVAACNAYNEAGQLVAIVFGKLSLKYQGFHFSYCLQDCEQPEPTCETAFAYNEDFSICFIEGVNGVSFNNWGWTTPFSEMEEGEQMEFDLWAGAGQCNLSRGTLVGSLTLSYFDGAVTAEYLLNGDFTFDETHLYIGELPFPKKPNGQYTVAPGLYPFKDNNASVWEDNYVKYEATGFEGDLYIIAHSVVCGNYDAGNEISIRSIEIEN